MDWGCNKEDLAFVRNGNKVLFVKRGKQWAFPTNAQAKDMVGAGSLSNGVVVYDNMDNFAGATTLHAWVETKITRYDVPTCSQQHGTWLPASAKNVYPLHRLLLDGV